VSGGPSISDALARSIDQMTAGTDLLLRAVSGLTDDQVHQPSTLPGWNRAAVMTHLARNADALTNLLTWAHTDVETPMYADPSRRSADIEAGAKRSAVAIRDDLKASNGRFFAGIAALPAGRWSFPIRTVQGRELPVEVVPWLRSREVWIHAIDLDAGVGFDDFPEAFVEALLRDSLNLFATRAQGAAVVVKESSGSIAERIGGDGEPVVVSGTARNLLPWLLGRADQGTAELTSSAGALPDLPPWL
jgi:maleylpyruvate isomerase